MVVVEGVGALNCAATVLNGEDTGCSDCDCAVASTGLEADGAFDTLAAEGVARLESDAVAG